MEYDRALYRVYERVIEDLSTSPDIIPPQTTRQAISSPSLSPVGRAGNVHNHGGERTTSVSSPSRLLSRTRNSNTAMTQQHFIPFFVPIACTPYVNSLLNNNNNNNNSNGNWRSMVETLRSSGHNSNSNPSVNNVAAQQEQHNSPTHRGFLSRFHFFRRNGYTSLFSNRDDQEVRSDRNNMDGVELSNLPNTISTAVAPTTSATTTTTTSDNNLNTSFSSDYTSTDSNPIEGSPLRSERQEEIPSTPTSPSSLSSAGLRHRRVASPSSPHSTSRATSFDVIETYHSSEANSSISSAESEDEDEEHFINAHAGEAGSRTGSQEQNPSTVTDANINGEVGTPQRGQQQGASSSLPISQVAQRIAAAHAQRNNTVQTTTNNTSQNAIEVHTNTNNARDHDDDNVTCTKRGLFILMRISMLLGFWHLLVLYLLHSTYVDPVRKVPITTNSNANRNMLGKDNHIAKTCLEYALSTRPKKDRSHFAIDQNRNRLLNDDSNFGLLLGDDEILQIKILRGGSCERKQCSRVWKIDETKKKGFANRSLKMDNEFATIFSLFSNSSTIHDSPRKFLRRRKKESTKLKTTESDEHIDRMTQAQDASSEHGYVQDDTYSSRNFWNEPDYRFSTNDALTYLDDKMLYHLHPDIRLVNVTLSERCLSSGRDDGSYRFAESLSQIYGAYDTIVINALMYGIKSADGRFRSGYLKNFNTNERFSWSKGLLHHREGLKGWNILGRLVNKLAIILLTLISFFLITSVTALIVRVLTSSGVILLYPMFAVIRLFGIEGADDRLLEYSYPWIGRARRAVRRSGTHPQSHFLISHLAKLFLYYIMYEACQIAWITLLYNKSMPASVTLYLFSFAMIIEYFSMVFLRSALSIYFFPRVVLLYFTCFHIYFYSIPYGFFDIALIPWFCFMVHAMLFCIIGLEVQASVRGAVSLECPREVYTQLSWPEWDGSFPHEWTLFLPLNSRYIPLHDRSVEQEQRARNDNEPIQNNANNSQNAGGNTQNDIPTTNSSDANLNQLV